MEIEELIKKLKEFNFNIYLHSLSTMEEAEKLAINYGTDVNKAKIAALLHDCGKKINNNDNLTHSKLSSKLAKEIFYIEDEEILNAILYHTTGKKNMSMLEKIIFIADKIEMRRNYNNVKELRDLAYIDIDKAIIKSIEGTVEYVKMRNFELDSQSLETLNFLRRQNE